MLGLYQILDLKPRILNRCAGHYFLHLLIFSELKRVGRCLSLTGHRGEKGLYVVLGGGMVCNKEPFFNFYDEVVMLLQF